MAGVVKVAVVSGPISSGSTGFADFTKTGFGTPKACIVLLSFDAADDVGVAAEGKASIGFSDFTSDRCITHQNEDASAKVDCDARKSATKAYMLLAVAGGVDIDGGASTIADGVRLTNTTNGSASAVFATVIMFGGGDLVVDLRRTVINSVIDLTAAIPHSGFTDGNDKLIFFIGTDIAGEDSSSSGINSAFGVCHAAGSDAGGWTLVQRCLGWGVDHNANVGDPSAIISTDRVLDIITEGGAQDWGLEVTDLDHSPAEWTVTTRDAGAGAGMEVYSLALDLDDRSAKVGSVDSPVSGATWTPAVALGFIPQYVGLGLTELSSEDIISTDAEAGVQGISNNAGSGEEACHSWYDEDAAATVNTNNLFRSRVIDLRDHNVSTVLQDHSHLSFQSGGWTYTINTENETVAKKWFYWAIEEPLPANDPIDGTISVAATLSGTTKGKGVLAGIAVCAFSLAATLLATGALIGTLVATSTLSGTVFDSNVGNDLVDGTIASTSTLSASLIGTGALSGSADAVSTVSGTLQATGALAGSADAAVTFSGALAGTGALDGSTDAAATLSGTLTGSGILSGSADAVASFSGTIIDANLANDPIDGTIAATSTLSATLAGNGKLVGTASTAATFSGTISDSTAVAAKAHISDKGAMRSIISEAGDHAQLALDKGAITTLVDDSP